MKTFRGSVMTKKQVKSYFGLLQRALLLPENTSLLPSQNSASSTRAPESQVQACREASPVLTESVPPAADAWFPIRMQSSTEEATRPITASNSVPLSGVNSLTRKKSNYCRYLFTSRIDLHIAVFKKLNQCLIR